MDEQPSSRRSAYAVPESDLFSDAHVAHAQMVVEQSHEPPPHDWSLSAVDGDGDGDGD